MVNLVDNALVPENLCRDCVFIRFTDSKLNVPLRV